MALDPRVRDSSGQFSVKGTVTARALRKAWSIVPRFRRAVGFEAKTRLLEFAAVPSNFTADKIDEINGVIRGVSVITSGLIARGHDLEVDDVTLEQMQKCADSKGQVPVKVDHKSGAAAICGYLCNFHKEEGKLKADWHLLETHPQRAQILETARRMPRGVGLSASFVSPEKGERTKSGKNAARCEDLISVDYVTLPAANPDGMFAAQVDTPNSHMTPEEISAAIKAAVTEAVAPLAAQVAELKTALEAPADDQPDEISLEEAAGMTPEQLAEIGLTEEDVANALEQAQAAQAEEAAAEGQGDEEVAAEGEGKGEGEAVAAGAPAAAAAGAATGFAALTKRVTELEAQLAAAKSQKVVNAEANLIAGIEKDFEELTARNVALEQALEAASKPASAGNDHGGLRFFSEGKEEGAFERVVELNMKEGKMTKGQAFSSAVRTNSADYENYLVRCGVRKPTQL